MRRRRRAKPQQGASLVEVLVAVFLLSIAFLGMASLQAASLRGHSHALGQSAASMASHSLFEAMRADADSARRGAYNTDGYLYADACPETATSPVEKQLHDWCESLGIALGATSHTFGSVQCDTEGDCVVTVNFDHDANAASESEHPGVAIEGTL